MESEQVLKSETMEMLLVEMDEVVTDSVLKLAGFVLVATLALLTSACNEIQATGPIQTILNVSDLKYLGTCNH